MDELGLLKMSLLSIIATEEAEKLEKTKWAQYFDTPCNILEYCFRDG